MKQSSRKIHLDFSFNSARVDRRDFAPKIAPYWNLLAAILRQTQRDYWGKGPFEDSNPASIEREKRRHRDTAVEFLRSKSREPWSFLWVCAHLRQDPERIRAEIERGVFRLPRHYVRSVTYLD